MSGQVRANQILRIVSNSGEIEKYILKVFYRHENEIGDKSLTARKLNISYELYRVVNNEHYGHASIDT